MRGTIDGLLSPHPLVETLPAMLRDDPFARSLCAGFDELLAPVILDLDTFAAHLDPMTAPDDMLIWLAQWLGVGIDSGTDPVPLRGELPGQPVPGITVTVAAPSGGAIDRERLDAVIRSVTPAHIPTTVVVGS